MKSILLIAGHRNITSITNEGLRNWRSATALKKSTGAAGEASWVWDTLRPLLTQKLIEAGYQVFVTDAVYHQDIYSRDYDLCLALHFDGGGTDSRCICAKPRADIQPPFITAESSSKSDKFVGDWVSVYPSIAGIASHQEKITEGMTDYYAWDYVGVNTPTAIIEHGNNTCPADHDKLFNQTDNIARADAEAVKKFFGLESGVNDLEACNAKVGELSTKLTDEITANAKLRDSNTQFQGNLTEQENLNQQLIAENKTLVTKDEAIALQVKKLETQYQESEKQKQDILADLAGSQTKIIKSMSWAKIARIKLGK